jgi:hypothetical protein
VAEISSFAVFLGVPVVRQFDLGLFVARRREENQRKPAFFVVISSELDESQLVAVKVQRLVDVGHTNHRMEVFHCLAPSG